MDKKIQKHLKDNHLMAKFFTSEIDNLKVRPSTAKPKPGETKTSIQRRNLHTAPKVTFRKL